MFQAEGTAHTGASTEKEPGSFDELKGEEPGSFDELKGEWGEQPGQICRLLPCLNHRGEVTLPL